MTRLLIGYDGSDPARRAIATAAELHPGAEAIVLHAGSAPHATVIGPAPGPVIPEPPLDSLEGATEEAHRTAREVADEGARQATAAGLRATAQTTLAGGPADVAAAILACADEHAATLVVVGSRGRSALRRALLGSVSGAVVTGSHRPVLVVPPPDDDQQA